MRNFFAAVLIIGSAVLFAACTHEEEPVEQTVPPVNDIGEMQREPADPFGDQDTTEDTATDEGTVVDYAIDMSNFQYVPNTISAQPGQTVRVLLTNSEGMHDFVIDELDVSTEMVLEGEETVVEFTVPEDASGESYEFYCSVMDHREMGMVGTLIVE